MIAITPDICTCRECAELDRAHPREGRQLALVSSSGERPEALPLTDPDAPVCSSTDVSAPEGRTVETHALAAEAGDTSLMNAQTTIAKPPRRKLSLAAQLAAMTPPAVALLDAEPWARGDDGAYSPIDDEDGGYVGSWTALLANFDESDVGQTFATREAFDEFLAAARAPRDAVGEA